MMLLDLVCYDCLMEQIHKGAPNERPSEQILTPFEPVNDTGVYTVRCNRGHNSKTVIDNIDFEILFEYGLNAIADGYYREAVASLTASMERYFEFFIKTVAIASGAEYSIIDTAWKNIANQSERQLGAYIFLYCQQFSKLPDLLSSNSEVPFRNRVIHKGYFPTKEETMKYGSRLLSIVEGSLIELKNKLPKEVQATFQRYGYKRIAEEHFEELKERSGNEQGFACVNIMTTIDVMHGREINPDDGRNGNIEDRIANILARRTPRTLTLVKSEKK